MLEAQETEEAVPTVAAVTNVWKSYGGVPVLKGVSLELRPGEIHALAGGNGAGKSTLMKIMTGVVSQDDGSVIIGGEEIRRLSPKTAHENGIYMVPQEPKLFPSLSVRENIALSLDGLNVSNAQIREVAQEMAPHIKLNSPAGDLSISDQQLVEIIRGILRQAKVLIVDEPTSSLTAHEVDLLFDRLRKLSSSGVGIFYITHRMNEIFDLCSHVTVLRDGNMVFTSPVADTTVSEVVRQMVPNVREELAESERRARMVQEEGCTGDCVLEVKDLSGQGFEHVSLRVRAGEIVGIAGVVGSGRTELAETIYGIRPGEGAVLLVGEEYSDRSPANSNRVGITYVPEDRHANGVFLLGDIVQNTSSSIISRLSSRGFVKTKDERTMVEDLTKDLDLQQGSLARLVGKLSGGNQQKVSLAKALAAKPKAIILDEPSRGVDVGARADLYHLIRKLAEEGTAILVISSDFEEVVEIADRVLIMRDGTVAVELQGDEIRLDAVRDSCFNVEDGVVA